MKEEMKIKKKFWDKNIVPEDFDDEHYWVINKAIDFTYRELKKKRFV